MAESGLWVADFPSIVQFRTLLYTKSIIFFEFVSPLSSKIKWIVLASDIPSVFLLMFMLLHNMMFVVVVLGNDSFEASTCAQFSIQ